MSCYLRHLQAELEQAGIKLDEENRKKVDQAVHKVVGVGYKDCPKTWRETKKRMSEDKRAFLAELKEEIEGA